MVYPEGIMVQLFRKLKYDWYKSKLKRSTCQHIFFSNLPLKRTLTLLINLCILKNLFSFFTILSPLRGLVLWDDKGIFILDQVFNASLFDNGHFVFGPILSDKNLFSH